MTLEQIQRRIAAVIRKWHPDAFLSNAEKGKLFAKTIKGVLE